MKKARLILALLSIVFLLFAARTLINKPQNNAVLTRNTDLNEVQKSKEIVNKFLAGKYNRNSFLL